MSERRLRQRIPVHNRKSKHLSPAPRRRTPASNRRSFKRSRPDRILQRSKSEPNLLTFSFFADDDVHRNLTPPDALFFRHRTCTDIFSSFKLLPTPSPEKIEGGYRKDTKVVVNVTVEGSPGPIRTMVKLGSSVEETIKLVVNKYSEEGRSPLLDKHAASIFELHPSYFSLQCLSKSAVIGDVGSRSFYLRNADSDQSSSNGGIMVSASFTSKTGSATPSPPPLFFLQAFIARNIRKIIRKTRKLWKILGCMNCNG